ncbi:S8 family serine peptidase [Ruminiclostridium josui]|uniref:S8 family serine peptidase n=1 Tax=Ruminiclostridium josui TaxID=1499 RepID=UPI00046635A2|nr:S8 family serine peptidase [Ruminiclostridium josui]
MEDSLIKRQLKVAVIDSGIDINNINLEENIIDGIAFEYDTQKGKVNKSDNYQDENGHGTSCASIIKREVPDVGMFIIKILDKNNMTNSKALIAALKYLLEMDIRLINLSVATTRELYQEELKKVCDELYGQGKILVCSLENKSDSSYPAVFDHVIGVRGRDFNGNGDYWYNRNYRIQCVADSIPVLVPKINNLFGLFGKNSKATPLMTGKIARILFDKPNIDFKELQLLLEQTAVKNFWTEEDIYKYCIEPDEMQQDKYYCFKEEIKELADIIAETLNLTSANMPLLYQNINLRHREIGLKLSDCFDLIKNIEKGLNIKLNYNQINLNTFRTLYTLLDFVLEAKSIV